MNQTWSMIVCVYERERASAYMHMGMYTRKCTCACVCVKMLKDLFKLNSLDHVGIELVVPSAEQGGGHIKPLPVQR